MIADGDAPAAATRPSVSVIVPFAGDRQAAEQLLHALCALRLAAGDELILADNTTDGVLGFAAGDGSITVVRARAEPSAPHARNVGAEASHNQWLLFLDSDCVPEPGLLDAYFAEPPGDFAGALAGAVLPQPGDAALVRWAATRNVLNQEEVLEGDPRATGPRRRSAVSANLMVRRKAWDAVGGFLEGVVCGEDYDLCWRIQDDGWTIEPRFDARVTHHHRETLGALWRQMTRYGASNAWQARRWPGAAPRPALLRPLARSLGGMAVFGLTLQFDRARMKLVDGIAAVGLNVGYLGTNAVPRPEAPREELEASSVVIVSDVFGGEADSTATRPAELQQEGRGVRIEALARANRQQLGATRGVRVDFLEDDGTLDRLRALGVLVARHPLRCLVDVWWRRRLPVEQRTPLRALAPMALRLAADPEADLEVAAQGVAAASALRASRIVGARR